MMEMRQRKLTFALLALILILAGCKSESPTAPPIGGPSGGNTPPTNASVTLTASNTNPLVNSNVTLTAKVTVNNQNVPNGTAVQFHTTLGTFIDTGANSTIKITTDGIATATLTSAAAGAAIVSATVNNASAQVTVTFSTAPVVPPPPNTSPTITSITPAVGRPEGGETITITGTNFRSPVRVLFDPGNNQAPVEGFVASVSPTQVTVVTPRMNVIAGQTLSTDVILLNEAGTPTETRVVKSGGFTFASSTLTPVIRALQPTSGPIGGGTRVTIIGDAFQTPVQVFFGAAEAQIISVNFNQIIVMSPRASDTANDGSGVVTGPVSIRVRNIASGTEVTFSGGFRYTPKMQITTAGPTQGPFSGGTRVRIDGSGFDDPLAVSIGGAPAQVISVSGSQIIAITGAVVVQGCAPVTQGGTAIIVTNTDNGDTATGPDFLFLVPKPLITSITPNPADAGGTATIIVLNALGFPRITIGNVAANITGSTVNADGTTTFTVQIPTNLTLTTQSCPAGGTAPTTTAFTVTYTSATTGCTDSAPNGLNVNPVQSPVFFTQPGAFAPFSARVTTQTAGTPPVCTITGVTPSPSQTMNLVNNGPNCGTPSSCPLILQSITTTPGAGSGCTNFAVAAPPIPPNINLNSCEALPISVTYNGTLPVAPPCPPTPSTDTCTLTITTNAGTKTFLLVGTTSP